MDLQRSLGLNPEGSPVVGTREELIRYINLKLAALGAAVAGDNPHTGFLTIAHDLLADFREFRRLLEGYLCPIDQRIQNFLTEHFKDQDLVGPLKLPTTTFVVDRHGMSREMSLPIDQNEYKSDYVFSYRVRQGVLHNPKSDRRTTQGVFHVAEGGLPIPADKVAVPKKVFGNLLHAAFNPPKDLLALPFSATQTTPAELFCSLLLRPIVCPAIPGFAPEKSMEVRFFAPGALVSNLDFVESIFGNAGDPYIPENDAGLDVEHWTGHTGCVILAPHLVGLKKKSLGLPAWNDATDRQRREGACWKSDDELYNGGKPFKITCRTMAGVMVTILADNYYGYSKKEVKTQISYAANLFGIAEEEHAGGALAFASYSLGEQFKVDPRIIAAGYTFEQTLKALGDKAIVHADGYAVDRKYPSVIYVPEDVQIDLPTQRVWWTKDGTERQLKLFPDVIYIHPTGYKIRLEKHPGAPSWRLVGTRAEGTFCHKPCTVSGGGKSEISKSIAGSVVYGPIYVADWDKDWEQVEHILDRDFSDRFLPPCRPDYSKRDSRPLLSHERSLGSVIKMLTPSPADFTPEYNAWLETIPNHVRSLVFFIKRFYKPEWGENWRTKFSVDRINGSPGHELKMGKRKAVGSYLRVGMSAEDGSWRLFKLRQDYIAADKVQMEDDISASAVVPASMLANLPKTLTNPSVKLVENCEYRLFQRPDDAIHRGMDAQTEEDMAADGLFASNFEPISASQAQALVEDVVEFDKFTKPMQDNLRAGAKSGFVVSSAHPRIVEGKPSKNPRYLQIRPDVARPRDRYVAEVGARLLRRVAAGDPVVFPVSAVLGGRRNNPREPGVRPLAVYNPIHYQDLPELFMDYVCSLTGKSPSTTGAGSEGALTKAPFNALRPSADLNNAVVDFVLTGYPGFSTAAGFVGPRVRVDHDISLLIPEMWARLEPRERQADYLMQHGYLEAIPDMKDSAGRVVLSSRLGYRITSKFIHDFFGRMFDNPARVFDEAILRPETQDLEQFIDGVDNIVEAQRTVAKTFFDDGSIEECCPPLRAILTIMAADPADTAKATVTDAVRKLFTRENVLGSDWYQQRLLIKQKRDIALWERHVAYLEAFTRRTSHRDVAQRMNIAGRLRDARNCLAEVVSARYLQRLHGTIGADPLGPIVRAETVTHLDPLAAAIT